MKNTKRCTKCECAEIIRIPGMSGAASTGNHVMTGLTIFSMLPVSRYVCSRCGFSEDWVDDPEVLAKLVKKYRP